MNNFVNRRRYELRAVVNNAVIQVGREGFFRFFQYFQRTAYSLHGIGIGRQADHEACLRLAIEVTFNVIILSAQFYRGDIADADHRSVRIGADDDVPELFGSLETAFGAHRILVRLVVRRRLRADGADGSLDILAFNSRNNIRRRDLKDIHLQRVHPDTHGVVGAKFFNVADAGNGFQGIHKELGCIVLHERGVISTVRGIQGENHSRRTRRFLDRNACCRNFLRQCRLNLADAVLRINRVHVVVTARFELDGQGIPAAVVTGAGHVYHVVDADHLAFDDAGDGITDNFGVSACIGRGHADLRRRNVRIFCDRQGHHRQETGNRYDQRYDDGEDRPVNKEF